MSGWNDSDVAYLQRLRDAETAARADQVTQVAWLREHGCPWSIIAEALGMSRQSAWERFKDAKIAPTRDMPL